MKKLHRGTDTTFYEISSDGVRTYATERGTPEGRHTYENQMSFEQFDRLAEAVQSFRDVMDAKPADAVEAAPAEGPTEQPTEIDPAAEALHALSDRALQAKAVKIGVRVTPGLKGVELRNALIAAVLTAQKKAPAKRPKRRNG